ncbi:hypothetical protein PMNALOAF_3903 [Methylobacterium adhaesivum]|jgi:hypothetical protein|uniref:DUF2271 domain-containing protein n=1 Tax=Methylobacterium adhaesivum TaxID=333297 RepID=A0ABT8BII0_9HYPH|nr:DUF2271 domain-containing protein [Methylobacterium adhaesivum]MDN3591972.1 DUF2271 domain-containing protein [Methylobacterium adhaesivum]GJD32626.1 hypothetical protein PMNALOAF_3903 [Methylobacterium adhaesivum]
MRKAVTALFPTLIAAPVMAGEVTLSIQIPRLDVSEYHRPYVAAWIEGADGAAVSNLAVWYDLRKREGEGGAKWLKDLRQWWRRIGRETEMPLDGVSGATRPVGTHALRFATDAGPLTALKPGTYEVVVEAAREVGGREVVRLPLAWPLTAPSQAVQQGKDELGTVALDLKP